MPHRDANAPALLCYRCGASLETLSLPLGRLDLCPGCGVELHVCRMCVHYAPARPEACDEDDAVEVRNKTAANFCDYFAPTRGVFDGREQQAEAVARQQLEALFGATEEPTDRETATDQALAEAEKLFGK